MKLAPIAPPAVALALVFGLGCTGSITAAFDEANDLDGQPGGDPSRPEAPFADDGFPGPFDDLDCEAAGIAPRPMRRLTRAQFDNAVVSLFGAQARVDNDFPATAIAKGEFRTFARANPVTADGAERMAEAAAAIGKRVTTNPTALLGCDPGEAADDGCVAGYIERLASRAYRRRPEDAELGILADLYAKLRARPASISDALAAVVEAVLQSPQFLYQYELGRAPEAPAGSVHALSDHEVAARLALGLWNDLPDDDLRALAESGTLHSPAQIEGAARRLLADARAEPVVAAFVEDWLLLQRGIGKVKDADVHPGWTSDTGERLRAEIGAFANEVMFRSEGTFAELLSAPWMTVSDQTAWLYGRDDGVSDERAMLDPDRRAGLLTSGAFLATHAGPASSLPIVRGMVVRESLLCTVLEPPAGLMVASPSPDPNLTLRQQLAEHSENAACASCHAYMDPIGFGLENYDGVGQWRSTERNNLPIDSSGELYDAGDASGPFGGGVELAHKLATSNTAKACFARQWLSYLEGRAADGEGELCALRPVYQKFLQTGGNLQELVIAIVTNEAFRSHVTSERGEP